MLMIFRQKCRHKYFPFPKYRITLFLFFLSYTIVYYFTCQSNRFCKIGVPSLLRRFPSDVCLSYFQRSRIGKATAAAAPRRSWHIRSGRVLLFHVYKTGETDDIHTRTCSIVSVDRQSDIARVLWIKKKNSMT